MPMIPVRKSLTMTAMEIIITSKILKKVDDDLVKKSIWASVDLIHSGYILLFVSNGSLLLVASEDWIESKSAAASEDLFFISAEAF